MGINSGFKGLSVQYQMLENAWYKISHTIAPFLKKNLSFTMFIYFTQLWPAKYYLVLHGVLLFIFNYALQPLRLIVRSGLDVPTFATRRLHACHHARAPSGGRWNCGLEMSGNFA